MHNGVSDAVYRTEQNKTLLVNTFSREQMIPHLDLSYLALCIMGSSRFWLMAAIEENKSIPHELSSCHAPTAAGQCVEGYLSATMLINIHLRIRVGSIRTPFLNASRVCKHTPD